MTTIRNLELNDKNDKTIELLSHVHDRNHVLLYSLNIHGLKHLLKMNRTVFEFDDPTILDSITDLVSGNLLFKIN